MPNVDHGLSAMHDRSAAARQATDEDFTKPTRDGVRAAHERLATYQTRPSPTSAPNWHLRSRTSQALVNSELEMHQRQLWEMPACGILVVDIHGAMLNVNQAALRLLKPAEVHSGTVSLFDCVSADDASRLSHFLNELFSARAIQPIDLHVKYLAEDENVHENCRCLRMSVISVGSLTASLSVADVSELKQMEARCRLSEDRLRQLQRLELVHTMSAGIMHDFKNIVHVIESYAAILQGQSANNGHENAIANQIMSAASRGAMLADRWLMFSRHGELETQRVDMNSFVRSSLESIRSALPSSINVEVTASERPIECSLDPCLIEQVLFNLCSNARDAMPGGGRLQVSVEPVEFDSQASSSDLLPAGAYAKISIADTGTGIASEDLDRIFEPFFTTKTNHTGTGLGLSLVRCIISEHQGAIEVWSEVGKGSTFVIYLPISSAGR